MKTEYIRLIQKLSDPSLEGRVPGTKGHDTAKNLILEQFKRLSLTPLFDTEWEQSYTAFNGQIGQNLLACRKGIEDKWLLLGAHYDHVRGCPGANDNAAAIGILLSVIDSLKSAKLNITIVLAFFDMEEQRYFMTNSMGSIQFYHQSLRQLDYDQFLGTLILDLCGHNVPVKGRENALLAVGANSSPLLSKSMERAQGNIKDLQVYRLKSREFYYLSDHYIFDINKNPNLFITCGHDPRMHTPKDTFENLNLKKIEAVTDLVKQTVLNINSDFEGNSYPPFNREAEAAELGRFLEVELGPHHNLDLICQVLLKELKKGQPTDLGRIRYMMKALRIL